jgi:hypothetical protein
VERGWLSAMWRNAGAGVVWTPKSGTNYCTPEDGHTSARNILSQ